MMIVKLIGIALIGIVAVSLLRTAKPEFAVFAVIGTGIVMVITMISSLQSAILAFDDLVDKSGIDDRVFSAVLKIIGIGYLTEYSASIATDAGCASIAQKLQFGGKIVIFLMSISIVTALVDVIGGLLNLV
ncbi:MAG TPA: stage III sporulation protein AD [Candidatus Limadaptatus stercorigallinarum]|uniref:Stage III sporulation protein AD n=1 Tax=Candidatus Limadaptatus stercorigallinarum TaxID=2840845 RepID=A0A9D1HTB8_9FIRM|nr:SpoIIIAC/SpoIIIAD family protein [Christensenellales bacterium]HIU20935.1 stage III sporulation protein AD [Candidatus Limadaptatus stercorigallinarum]